MASVSKLALMATVLAALVVIGCQPSAEGPGNLPALGVPDADLKALAEGNNAFAIDLYKKLAAESDGNVVVSPYSIRTALAMTYAGARGETASEMAKVLGFGSQNEKVHAAAQSLAGKLSRTLNVGRQEFRSRNSLWLNEQTPFVDDFLRIARSNYDAQVTQVDFEQPEVAVAAVNQWVDKETDGRIRNLLENRDVSKETRLVLANATFLKGLWQYPFDKSKTADAKFFASSSRTAKVKMMQLELEARFWEGNGIKIASIPLQKNTASMMVIVPNQVDGLAAIESKLTPKLLSAWYKDQTEVNLSLHFPRWTVRNKYDLVPTLRAMGMERPFDPKADFSGISQGIGLSKVIHEATVVVDEEGSEATAATAVVGAVPVIETIPLKHLELKVERPFCFAIWDHGTQSILFMGRVALPD